MAAPTELLRGRLTLWVVIGLGVPLIVLFLGTLPQVGDPAARISLQALTLVWVGIWLFGPRGGRATRSPLVPAILLLCLVTAASALTSQRPAASLEALALLLLAAPAYLVVLDLIADRRLRDWIDSLAVAITLIVLVGFLVQVLALWIQWWAAAGPRLPPLRPGDVAFTLGSANVVGAYIELLVPLSAVIVLGWSRARWWTVLLLGAASIALVATGSRGAALGAGCAVVAFVALRWSSRPRGRLLVVAGLSVTAVVLAIPFVSRFAVGDAGRLELWRAAIAIAARWPLLGGGPGTWPSLRPLSPITQPDTAVIATAHDGPLYVLAELGVVGLLAVGILVATVTLLAVRARRATSSRDRLRVDACTASLVAIAAHSLVDPMFHLAGVVLLVLFLVAQLEAATPLPTPRAAPADRFVCVAAAAGVIVAALILVRVDAAILLAREGDRALDSGDAASAIAAYDRALALDDRDAYRLGRAVALGDTGQSSAALAELRSVFRSQPLSFIEAQIAVLAQEAGETSEARRTAAAVTQMGTYDPTAMINAALVMERGGATASAAEVLARTMVSIPGIVTRSPPPGSFSRTTWDAAIDTAIQRLGSKSEGPWAAADLAERAGRIEQAASLVSASPPGPIRTLFEQAALARAGQAADLAASRAAIRAVVGSRLAIARYARVAAYLDSPSDLRAAEALARVALRSPSDPRVRLGFAGRSGAVRAARSPGYAEVLTGRNGPSRIHLAHVLTITPEDP